MKKTFPLHGIFGIVLLLVSEFSLFKKVDPFYSWFYCFAWWSYILIIDAVIYRLRGNSLIVNRTREFLFLIPWSIFLWLIFEAANLSKKLVLYQPPPLYGREVGGLRDCLWNRPSRHVRDGRIVGITRSV